MYKNNQPEIITLRPKKLIGLSLNLEQTDTENLLKEISFHWETNISSFYQTMKNDDLIKNLVSEKGYDIPERFGESRWHYMMIEVQSRRGFPASLMHRDIQQSLAVKLMIETLEEASLIFENFLESWLDDNGYKLSNNSHFLQYPSIWNPYPPFEYYFPIKKKSKKDILVKI